jgi:hypothetical protein
MPNEDKMTQIVWYVYINIYNTKRFAQNKWNTVRLPFDVIVYIL